jgi:hypothetical protein
MARFFEELNKLSEAIVELPFVTLKHLAGVGGEEELHKSGWKAYDALVRFVNAATDETYASPAFGYAAGRSMETALKWQRLNSAISNAFFSALWPAMGLPTVADLNELRAQVSALHDELADARLEALEARAHQAKARPAKYPASETGPAAWNGWIPLAAAPFAAKGGRKDGPAN